MLKICTIIGSLLIMLNAVDAQDLYIKNRWNIQAGHSLLKTSTYYVRGNELDPEKTSHFDLGVNYGFYRRSIICSTSW